MTTHSDDDDFLFDVELPGHTYDLQQAMDKVKMIHANAESGTKASNYYFTLWSAMNSVSHAILEARAYRQLWIKCNRRVDILERLLLMVLDKDADLSGDKVTLRIIEALKVKKEEAAQVAMELRAPK